MLKVCTSQSCCEKDILSTLNHNTNVSYHFFLMTRGTWSWLRTLGEGMTCKVLSERQNFNKGEVRIIELDLCLLLSLQRFWILHNFALARPHLCKCHCSHAYSFQQIFCTWYSKHHSIYVICNMNVCVEPISDCMPSWGGGRGEMGRKFRAHNFMELNVEN